MGNGILLMIELTQIDWGGYNSDYADGPGTSFFVDPKSIKAIETVKINSKEYSHIYFGVGHFHVKESSQEILRMMQGFEKIPV